MWGSSKQAWVGFWGPLGFLRASRGPVLGSLRYPEGRTRLGPAVPRISEKPGVRFCGPPSFLGADGVTVLGFLGSPLQTRVRLGRWFLRVSSEHTGVRLSGSVSLRADWGSPPGWCCSPALPRSPPGPGCAAARDQLPSEPGRCRGCQDRGPTDFAGTRPRHSRWMPGFLQNFVGNAHLSKGKTTEFAQISELTFALKKAQFSPLTNSDVLRLPRRNYCC